MQSFFLTYKSSRIHYLKSGSGLRTLICFHGYGECADAFARLSGELDRDFTVFAVDLPFHGKTQWLEGLHFSPDELCKIVQRILQEAGQPQADISLLGFSMGGRVVLSILGQLGPRVCSVVLLAPDGLRVNFWYWLTTQTWPGHQLFRFTMDHPHWFFGVLRLVNALGLVNPSVYKFVSGYVDDPQGREQLYKRWTVMRKFRPDLARIKSVVLARAIRLSLVYGRHDRIIRHSRAQTFRRGIEPRCEVIVLDGGHQLLQEKNLDIITGCIKR
jgi:pimeloyl-ACP methyl ester carboxylesterase